MIVAEIVGIVILLVGALLFGLGAQSVIRATNRRAFKLDVAPAKGSAAKGIAYSFTLGMMPWAKESTRRHLVAYTRGIVFHVAVFGAFALLLVSPWIRQWHETIRFVAASGLALGALAALGGYWIRASDEAVRAVSTPDDYFSLGLVTAFIASAALACVVEPAIPGLWAISGIVIAYIPISKLKHSIYFFYTRTLFGAFFGYRGVLKISRRSS